MRKRARPFFISGPHQTSDLMPRVPPPQRTSSRPCESPALTQKLHSALLITLAFVVSNTISFGVGRYFISTPKPTPAVASQDPIIDSLIYSWVEERMHFAEMGMLDNSGVFAVGTFPDTVRTLAARLQEAYQVPSAVTLAQFALESRFGTRHMSANNFFGHTFPVAVKYAPPPPRSVALPTKEFVNGREVILTRKFAKYRNIEECFTVHGRLLFNGYSSAQQFRDDPPAYARAIGRRYATDPDYALKLITIMKRYKLI